MAISGYHQYEVSAELHLEVNTYFALETACSMDSLQLADQLKILKSAVGADLILFAIY